MANHRTLSGYHKFPLVLPRNLKKCKPKNQHIHTQINYLVISSILKLTILGDRMSWQFFISKFQGPDPIDIVDVNAT